MKMTIEQQAAMGRMGYAIRALTNGVRTHQEEFDLLVRALMLETINLCLTKYHGRSLTSGQADFYSMADDLWQFVNLNNPELLEREGGTAPDKGGN